MLMQLKIGLVLLLLGINNAFKSTLKKNHHSKSGEHKPIIKSHSKSGNTNPLPSKHPKVMGTQTHHKKNHKWVTDPH